MKFFVARFDEKDAPAGRIFEIKISDNPKIVEMEFNEESKPDIFLRGDSTYASRLWFGYSELLPRLLSDTDWAQKSALTTDFLKDAMSNFGLKMILSPNLQDRVALAKLLIRTEIDGPSSVNVIQRTSSSTTRICRTCTRACHLNYQ